MVDFMRAIFAGLCLVLSVGIAAAQKDQDQTDTSVMGDSPDSTGRTVVPSTQGQQQPQGPTGPIETKSGGAPAESPQGQTPPGMQAAPEGSSKTIVDSKK
jgi:hypothetical protein